MALPRAVELHHTNSLGPMAPGSCGQICRRDASWRGQTPSCSEWRDTGPPASCLYSHTHAHTHTFSL